MSPEAPIIVLILAIPTYFICKWVSFGGIVIAFSDQG